MKEEIVVAGWAPYVAEWESSARDRPPTRWSIVASLTHIPLSCLVGFVFSAVLFLPALAAYFADSPVVSSLLLVLQVIAVGYTIRWVMNRESSAMSRLHRWTRQRVSVGEHEVSIHGRGTARVVSFTALKAPWLFVFPWFLLLRRHDGWPIALFGREELRDVYKRIAPHAR